MGKAQLTDQVHKALVDAKGVLRVVGNLKGGPVNVREVEVAGELKHGIFKFVLNF